MGEGNIHENKNLTVSVYKSWVLEFETPTTLRFVQVESQPRVITEVEKPEGPDDTLPVNQKEEEIQPEEDDVAFLRSLDPKEWKKQDHYQVLGLHKHRYNATESDIKKAYRRKVLRHHPDKRKAQGERILEDDDYFTCITRAWETLGDKSKRRSYDSVDPYFDDTVPTGSEYNKTNFYKVFGEAFELNSRWSEKMPVPKLGGADSSREQVDKFYTFWYSFESWRDYAYLDEEEKEKGQDREERKWIEKQNKVVRVKRKKEEMTRIRNLVDLAYSIDPRIAKFKNEDKEKKIAAKKAKQDAARARYEEEERMQKEVEDKARAAKEAEEAEERARNQALKAEREVQKKALKKERKTLRDLCKKNNYYSTNQEELVLHMTDVEKVCECYDSAQLSDLTKDLQENGRDAFLKMLQQIHNKIQEEKKTQLEMVGSKQTAASGDATVNKKNNNNWPADHIQMLIKAVNMFPAGTNQRWEVVANFLNQHCTNGMPDSKIVRTAKEVLAKAKELKGSDFSKSQLKDAANQKAYSNFEKEKKGAAQIEAETSERFESVAEQQGLPKPWTSEEQQLLEQALKTYNSTTPDRWDRIASCIPSRTKKDCMRRYKEICEMVKAKRAAQALGKK